MAQTRSQFHHYIPRFILKTFADNFTLTKSDTDFIADTSSVFKATDPNVRLGRNKQKGKRGKRGHQRAPNLPSEPSNPPKSSKPFKPSRYFSYNINVYRVEDHSSELNDTSRVYGLEDMYRDINEDDCMKLEKLLSKLESFSSQFIRKIWSGEDLSLTRAQLADMKKFLCIMMYRGEARRSQYYDGTFDMTAKMTLVKHMKNKKFKRLQDVWFDNLKWIIETPADDILDEWARAMNMVLEDPISSLTKYMGPIHVLELLDYGHRVQCYVCVWEAEEGSEFIICEGSFGAYEGTSANSFHIFFIVSPRYAIVLANRLFMWDEIDAVPGKTWFGDHLRAIPETIYKKGPLPGGFLTEDHMSPDDVFKYRRIIAPRKDVYMVNGISLDARRKYLTYKSSACLYKSLQYYDKVKKGMFPNQHDYTILKRKLFADMNRTHAS
ncbi:hypothetical protein BGX34_001462 [Mortierella sp. NVP85]|nr:hypothetical protein BGX34_001462 [Mortierella sp. NVP85]